jgi:uncharacterized membrane protein
MMVLIGIVLGALVGGALFHDGGGVVVGALLGWLTVAVLDLSARLRRIEHSLRAPAAPATREAEPQRSWTPPPEEPESPPEPIAEPQWAAPPAAAPSAAAPPAMETPIVERWLKDLLFGGNTAVRVGVVVLFYGVAFLLKYAIEHNRLPIELRLAGAALGGIVLLVLGWRLRERRRGYAETLQGGGIGILYLTVFAALRLYALLPPAGAFALLVGIVAASVLLALLQGSLALAVLGVTGGFLAPILTSTGSGDHVLLFSYYALLNAGILAIAWFRSWRLLNLVGFVFTFVIGSWWGYRFYQPALLATTEPFLVLFLLMYVAIAVLFAFRQKPELRGYVDGTLVFGVPIVAALLQAALVRDIEYGLAWSAFGLGLFYLVLASALLKRAPQTARTLVEAFLALGVIFATLAIPLALDGRWTAAAWAVEGAGITWVGVRQRRLAPRLFGVLLVFAAGIAFLADPTAAGGLPVLNARYVGALMISVAALLTGWFLDRGRTALRDGEPPLIIALLVWGLLWWYGAGLREIGRHVTGDYDLSVMAVFVALSCVAAEWIGARAWAALRASAAVLWPALALCLALQLAFEPHPFAHGGYVAWPLAIAALYRILWRRDADAGSLPLRILHAGAFWLVTALAAFELHWALGELIRGGRDWPRLALLLAPGAMLAFASASGRWPFAPQRATYVTLAALPVAVPALLAVLWLSMESRGEAAPLPYLPLLNPLDLATAFLALALARLFMAWRGLPGRPWAELHGFAPAALGAVGFVWMNAILFRSLHHYAGIDYSLAAMLRSVLAQAAMSLFWSALALVLVTFAVRVRHRVLWFTGAGLLAVVVAKLFLVDLANTGTMARIVSFIGVGVLLLIIGYLSPVPPRAGAQEERA